MQIRLDPDSTVPIYLQIVHAVKHLVAAGALKPGEQLPTVRELATDLRINPNTVARAYDVLDGEQVISTQQGRGTYVREHHDDAHLSRVRQEHLKALVEGVIGRALSTGYTVGEIREAFEEQLSQWIRTQNA